MIKNNIILDIDETLVHSEIQSNNFIDTSKNIYNYIKLELLKMEYYVYLRPGLYQFLEYCFKNFNVGFWTAGNTIYCNEVLKAILNPEQFELSSIIISRKNNHYIDLKKNIIYPNITNNENIIKPLEMLLNDDNLSSIFNKSNTFIVDDNPNILSINPNNSILVEPFDIENNEDYILIKLISKLEKLKTDLIYLK